MFQREDAAELIIGEDAGVLCYPKVSLVDNNCREVCLRRNLVIENNIVIVFDEWSKFGAELFHEHLGGGEDHRTLLRIEVAIDFS